MKNQVCRHRSQQRTNSVHKRTNSFTYLKQISLHVYNKELLIKSVLQVLHSSLKRVVDQCKAASKCKEKFIEKFGLWQIQ